MPFQDNAHLLKPLMSLLKREIGLSFSKGGGPILAMTFYATITLLFILGTEGVTGTQASIHFALGSSFSSLALTSLLSLERLFERDYEEGCLDLWVMGTPGLGLVSIIKCFAQWSTNGVALAFMSPVMMFILGGEVRTMPLMFISSLLSGLGFSFIGGLGASLVLGVKRGGLLIAAIVLPLFVPVIIFGTGSVKAFSEGLSYLPALALLTAYCLWICTLTPIAMAAACRNVILR